MKGNVVKRPFYTMADAGGDSAEITMYGDIVESVPVDWWTGEEIPGNYIVMGEFLTDLETLKTKKNITIRMNSCGGDAGVSITIHNRLRELAREGKNLVCIVDGMAMSGGSLIMCACDTVQVNPSSLIMIHKCWSFYYGVYNADELRQAAEQADAYDNAQVAIYTRKTGMTDTKIRHMMGETTYMTGKEAVEKGFADALLEDAQELNFAASADGRTIFMGNRAIHMMPGLFAPDSIPTVSAAEPGTTDPAGEANTSNQPGVTGETGGFNVNLEELRQNHPELVEQIEAAARAAGNAEAAAAAVSAERRRLQEIDAIAAQVPEDMLAEARYGETACSAQELAYRAMSAAAKNGTGFLAGMAVDYAASGAAGVGAVPPADETAPKTEAEKKAAAKNDVAGLFGKKGE